MILIGLWAMLGFLVYQGFQLATPTLDLWLGHLVYGRVTEFEFWGAVRLLIWVMGTTLVHLAPYVGPIMLGPIIIRLDDQLRAIRNH